MDIIDFVFNFILFFIASQFTTISHEFGHAIPALIFTKDNVTMHLGNTTMKLKIIRLRRLSIEIGTFQPFLGIVNLNGNDLSKLKSKLISAGGPLVSLFIGIILIFISGAINNEIIKRVVSFSGFYHIWQFICTAIPITYPKWWSGYGGYKSDGYYIFSDFIHH